jgi:hypothetical protein
VLGTLVVQTEPGARVTAVSASGERIDLGETDAGGSLRVDDALRIGSYSIEISKKGRRNLEQRIDLEAGRETRVDAALDSLPGELRVFTAPQGAEISIDGVVKGRTSGTIQDVPTGRPVTVEVYLPGYRRQRQTLTLGPSEVRTLNLGTLAVEGGGLAVSLTPDSLARDSRVVLSVDDRPFPRRGETEPWRPMASNWAGDASACPTRITSLRSATFPSATTRPRASSLR